MKNILFRIKLYINKILRSESKLAFIYNLDENDTILDIGCGNSSGKIFKLIKNNDIIGIDISKLDSEFFDDFVFSTKDTFNNDVKMILDTSINTVICTHVLEHVNNYLELVNIISQSDAKKLYLSFPSIKSLSNPKSRYGTLNFYQDKTHINVINFDYIIKKLQSDSWKIEYSVKEYKPVIPYIIGFLWQPIFILSRIEGPLYSTYSYYGFESIIKAKK